MSFQKSEGTPGVPRNYLAARDRKSGLISTYLALLGSYGLQSAQKSLIALRITPLGSSNSKIGGYFKIAQIWPIDRDQVLADFKVTPHFGIGGT